MVGLGSLRGSLSCFFFGSEWSGWRELGAGKAYGLESGDWGLGVLFVCPVNAVLA